MIVVNIVGGLGNQIAQYLYGRCCADRLGVELKLDLRAYKTYKLHAYGLGKFNIRAEVASDAEIAAAQARGVVRETTLVFDPAIPLQVQDGIYLDGYWGDYRYTADRIAQLQAEFQPVQALHPDNVALLPEIAARESVSLHIRRGDYVTTANCVVLPLTYYEDAVAEVMARLPNAHVYVFSDDIPWAEAHLQLPCPHSFVRGNDASRNLDDFQLMRACKHHIIANSTFSGWAASLDGKQGLVIAPQQYFSAVDPYLVQTFGRIEQPVWPPHWISLPIRRPLPAIDYRHIAGGFSAGRPMVIGVWNYYEELTTDGFIFKNQNASIGHNLLKPWVDLHAYGQANGMRFVTVDQVASLAELEAVIFMDRPRQDSAAAHALLALDIPKYLCIFETELIKPDNWDLEFHQRFTRIFTWSDAHVDHDRYQKLNFAIDPESPFDFAVLKTAFTQRKLATLIAGAKTSNHPNELYSARVTSIEFLQAQAPDDFDFYGMGWNAAAFSHYRGPVRDKLSALARYRFAICYENAANYPGYVTEKILDCFRAGVVPVYRGAPNIDRLIPSDCYIDRRQFDSEDALLRHLQAMDADTHGAYLDRIAALLASPKIYPYTIECMVTTLTGTLAKDIKERRGECPDVTVAIPSYNYGRFLAAAVRSALVQDVPSLEVLVFDNASTDDTPQVMQAFAGEPRVRYMRNTRNIGAVPNWNVAAATASGRYLTLLSADDFLVPGHLGRMREVMDARPELALAYSPCIWVDENYTVVQVAHHSGHTADSYIGGRDELTALLVHDSYITPSAALIRRAAFARVGRFNPDLHGAVDWELWIRLAELMPNFAFFKEPRVCYRLHGAQSTRELLRDADLLEDHLLILQQALSRGVLPRLRGQADSVLALLRTKYSAYPPVMVAHLQAAYAEVERALLGQRAFTTPAELQSVDAAFAGALHGTLEIVDLINAANALCDAARLDLAAALYRLWLAQAGGPLRYAAAFNLGTVLERMGAPEQAVAAYQQALQWQPGFDAARARLAVLRPAP